MDTNFSNSSEIERRRQIVQACRRLLDWKLVTGSTGNASTLEPDRKLFLITPSAMDYQLVGPQDIMLASLDSDRVAGKRSPSSEIELHRALYRARADVSVIIHFHSTFAQAAAIARKTIPIILDEAADIGVIRTAPYSPPGSQELAKAAADCLGMEDNAVLLANHGAVVVGRSIAEALERAIGVERLAQIYVYAHLLGGAHALTEEAIGFAKRFATQYSAAQARNAHIHTKIGGIPEESNASN